MLSMWCYFSIQLSLYITVVYSHSSSKISAFCEALTLLMNKTLWWYRPSIDLRIFGWDGSKQDVNNQTLLTPRLVVCNYPLYHTFFLEKFIQLFDSTIFWTMSLPHVLVAYLLNSSYKTWCKMIFLSCISIRRVYQKLHVLSV